MKKSLVLFHVLCLVFLLIGLTVLEAHAKEASAMKPQTLMANGSVFPAKFPDNVALTRFCEEIEKKTNGLITFKYAWSGSLTKRGEVFKALKGGIVDVSLAVFAWHPKTLYLNLHARAVPFISSDPRVQADIVDKLFKSVPALHAEWEKQGAKLLVPHTSNSFELQSRMPIKTLKDFEGKKIVISGVRAKKWFTAVGATPVTVSLPNRAMSFQTGMIDGSVVPFDISYPFGLRQYAKHATLLGLGAWLASGIVISKKRFDSFPEDIQGIILEAAENARQFTIELRSKNHQRALDGLKKAGVTLHTLSNEEKVKWMDLMGNEPLDWIKQGEKMGLESRKVMETYLSLIKESGHKFPREW